MDRSSNLKERTVDGFIWDILKTFGTKFSTFIVGIILARLLTPTDFGLIGMLTVFIAVSNIFINSGFKEALIQKQECTEKDYATIFYFNALVSFLLYLVLFLSAGLISDFFSEPRLEDLIKVLGLVLIINAFTFVQRARLTREMDFKLLGKVDVIANVGAGLIAISFALTGFGVWSLVIQSVAVATFSLILLWRWSRWKPQEKFNKESFRELFSFGSRLMVLGIIDTIYSNIYHVIIGKYYVAAQLGHYTRAQAFQNMPTSAVTNIFRNVSYPALSSIQDDKSKLKSVYRRVTKSMMLVTLVLIFGLAAIAEDLVVLLIGQDWQLAGEFLRLLCFAGLFYPINALNYNLMKVLGRSDLVLNLGIANKFLAVPVILTAIFIDIKTMLLVMIFQQVFVFWLTSYVGGRLIEYTTWPQVKDIFPGFLVASAMFATVALMGSILNIPLLFVVIVQVLTGAVISIGLFEVLRLEEYRYLKNIVFERISRLKK